LKVKTFVTGELENGSIAIAVVGQWQFTVQIRNPVVVWSLLWSILVRQFSHAVQTMLFLDAWLHKLLIKLKGIGTGLLKASRCLQPSGRRHDVSLALVEGEYDSIIVDSFESGLAYLGHKLRREIGMGRPCCCSISCRAESVNVVVVIVLIIGHLWRIC
jgi:hypothetical protein